MMWKSKRRSHYDGSGLNRSLVHQHDPIGSEFRLASEFAERPAARKPCARAQLTLKRTNSRHRQFSRARGAHDNPSQPSQSFTSFALKPVRLGGRKNGKNSACVP
ncbi:hypothetical protein CIRG_02514 [Coccidioides immitis RMSCC 2394]|uniref:Uncharacterized protein n=1 Tax=Coccidioides immitis RMSCC 2394 TaxID=404692 RepID=A0A0J7AZA5_COCIT|nr:hypothetical protein CIRG_02514 [Coccidioides immitis RMSCC 2394]